MQQTNATFVGWQVVRKCCPCVAVNESERESQIELGTLLCDNFYILGSNVHQSDGY